MPFRIAKQQIEGVMNFSKVGNSKKNIFNRRDLRVFHHFLSSIECCQVQEIDCDGVCPLRSRSASGFYLLQKR